MRWTYLVVLLAVACGSNKPAATPPEPQPVATAKPAEPEPAPTPTAEPPTQSPPEVMAADTPKATVAGNTFVAPAGWSVSVRGAATIVEAPEPGSRLALVDVKADSADAAVDLAWKETGWDHPWKLKVASDNPDHDGWTKGRSYAYETSPNEKRFVAAIASFANNMWTVVIANVEDRVAEKRGSQLGIMLGRLLPRGQDRESFAGKQARELDADRIKQLTDFVVTSQQLLHVPGVSVGIVQNGKIVFAGGFGVRELGKPAKVDADTKYMIASNTKALTTLMLAKLVDSKKLTWETTATSLLPSFKLGDADTTSQVLVKHLICACTGLPRQDLEWLFQFKGITPADALATLGTMQPTSKFGELFQYSNPLAAAAGFIGGHVAFPKLELGKAYDEAMRTLVFEPLGMKATTLDFARGQQGNAAVAHSNDIDGKAALAANEINLAIVPVRPAGGAWSSVRDMLRYVQMELAEGKVSGKAYISADALLARRAPQVAISKDATYGMGLMVDKTWGVTVVHHGGDMIGFHSDMMWLPEYGVGAVILTNGDPGWLIRSIFQRKLLEVLFDGRPEADAKISVAAKSYFDELAAQRKLITVPADPAQAAKLASHYTNAALGDIAVTTAKGVTTFDFGEWKSEVASKANPDGTVSFMTTRPGIADFELVVGSADGKRTLTVRDAQHEYVFTEK